MGPLHIVTLVYAKCSPCWTMYSVGQGLWLINSSLFLGQGRGQYRIRPSCTCCVDGGLNFQLYVLDVSLA